MSAESSSPVSAAQGFLIPLAALALGAALLLTVVYGLNRDRIATQQLAAEREALAEVLPVDAHDNDLLDSRFALDARNGFRQIALLGPGAPASGWRASLQGETSGVVLPAATRGFNGVILLMIGIDADGTITGVRVAQHSETRGLGDRIDAENSRWIRGFDNRSLENTAEVLWHVKKDGGDFDQFVGATITPRAVVQAIHNALLFFQLNRDLLITATTAESAR